MLMTERDRGELDSNNGACDVGKIRDQGGLARCGKHDGVVLCAWRSKIGLIQFSAGKRSCPEAASGPSDAALEKSCSLAGRDAARRLSGAAVAERATRCARRG